MLIQKNIFIKRLSRPTCSDKGKVIIIKQNKISNSCMSFCNVFIINQTIGFQDCTNVYGNVN